MLRALIGKIDQEHVDNVKQREKKNSKNLKKIQESKNIVIEMKNAFISGLDMAETRITGLRI